MQNLHLQMVPRAQLADDPREYISGGYAHPHKSRQKSSSAETREAIQSTADKPRAASGASSGRTLALTDMLGSPPWLKTQSRSAAKGRKLPSRRQQYPSSNEKGVKGQHHPPVTKGPQPFAKLRNQRGKLAYQCELHMIIKRQSQHSAAQAAYVRLRNVCRASAEKHFFPSQSLRSSKLDSWWIAGDFLATNNASVMSNCPGLQPYE